jgi:hypothetical protein
MDTYFRTECKTQQARLKPLRYAAAIENGMANKLGSDPGYVGLITKNPLNPHWSPYWSGADLYDLDYLADFVDLNAPNPKEKEGRSMDLAEMLTFLTIYACMRIGTF